MATNEEKIDKLEKQIQILLKKKESDKERVKARIQIPLPKGINPESKDLKNDIIFFKKSWENYLIATSLRYADEEEKVSVLLTAIGDECLKRFHNLPISEEDKKDAAKLLEKIEEHLIPKTNRTYERAIFNSTCQKADENIEQYINRLRALIKSCQYNNMEEELMLDRIVVSISNIELRRKLWQKENLTLNEAINICKIAEQAEIQLKKLDSPEEINKIESNANNRHISRSQSTKLQNNSYRAYSNSRSSKGRNRSKSNNQQYIENCTRCGRSHPVRQCPAWRQMCNKCGIQNHFKNMCKKSNGVKIIQNEVMQDIL